MVGGVLVALVFLGLVRSAAAREGATGGRAQPEAGTPPEATLRVVGHAAGVTRHVASDGVWIYFDRGHAILKAAMDADGKLVYAGEPVVVDSVVAGLAASEGYVYVATYPRMIVLDCSAIQCTRAGPNSGLGGGPWDHVASRNEYLFATRGASLAVLDIRDKTNPKVLSTLGSVSQDGTGIREIFAANSAVLVRAEKMWIVDVRDPMRPAVVGDLPVSGLGDVEAAGDTVFVVGDGMLLTYDLSDPTRPRGLSDLRIGSGDMFVTRISASLLATLSSGGISLVDVSNPMEPKLAGGARHEALDGYPVALAATSRGVVAAFDSFGPLLAGVRVFELDGTVLTRTGVSSVVPSVRAAAVDGDVGILGGYRLGEFGGAVQLMRLADPSRPVLAGYVSFEKAVTDVALDADLAYAGLAGPFVDIAVPRPVELAVLDVHDLDHPRVLATVRIGVSADRTTTIVPRGRHVFVGTELVGLTVVDVSDPAAPSVVATIPADSADDLTIDDQTAYLADRDRVLVVDLRDPAHPTIVDELRVADGGRIQAIAARAPYLFVATDRIRIFAPAADGTWSEIGTYQTLPGYVGDLETYGDLLLAAIHTGGDEGVEIVSVSTPERPLRSGFLRTWGHPGRGKPLGPVIGLAGGTLLVGDDSLGAYVVRDLWARAHLPSVSP